MSEPQLDECCVEEERLEASRVREKDWQRWGTYLPERQWGPVREVDIVLYCSSRNEFVSARVAQDMKARGISEVWILEGGLQAWVADGRPTTMNLSTGEEVAERVGIVLSAEMLNWNKASR